MQISKISKIPNLFFLALGPWLGAAEAVLDEVRANATPYRLDELNRNIYLIDSTVMEQKSFNSMQEVMASLPFVSLSNSGLGGSVDLRGQGISANTSVQVLLNGIALNPLDSSHGVTPLGLVGVSDIESIEILPGGGAVAYGNGTRGGVVNINTKKRYEHLSGNLGLGYGYAEGSGAKVDARIGGKVGQGLYLSFGGGYRFKEGYRVGDRRHLGTLDGNVTYDIDGLHSVGLDLGYFKALEWSSPLVGFSSVPNPSKQDRRRAGDGKILSSQDRISLGLNYDYRINERHKLGIRSFFHRYDLDYRENLRVMDYKYMGMELKDTQIDQGGSGFVDTKIGLALRHEFKHENGLLFTGFESIYNEGLRDMDLEIAWAGLQEMGRAGRPPMGQMALTSYKHRIRTQVQAKKWSSSLYVLERYDFSSSFSLTGGARYELAWYGGERKLDNDMQIKMEPQSPSRPFQRASNPFLYSLYKPIHDLRHNYALEITPLYHFSLGNLYAKYERGFRSPSPDNLTARKGGGASNNYENTGVKSETYDTFELGGRIWVGEQAMILLTGFYTLTHDEIYTIGSPHTGSGFRVGNYNRTQRAGAELASEQSFLDGMLAFSESFSYVDARILDSGLKDVRNGSLIPYVSNYKATLSLNYRFYEGWSLWLSSSFVGTQRDTAENPIPAYNLTDIGLSFSHKGFSLNLGVRNVADSLHYDFYNKDTRDVITGYAFLIGEGRSYFIEGRYRF